VINNYYRMIDISKKYISYRRACVSGSIYVGKKVFYLIKNKKIEKGDPIILAEIAGINAAKNISNLILLSHQINIENIFVNILMDEKNYKIDIYCIVFANSKTGVEMEAMCGVAIGLLTIYDLTKKLNPFIFIDKIKLLFKDGGENGLILGSINNIPEHLKKHFINEQIYLSKISVIIITMSDRGFYGYYNNLSGQILIDYFELRYCNIIKNIIIPDDKNILKKTIINISTKFLPTFILINGGTGLDKKDITFNTLSEICDKQIPGISELIRLSGSSYSFYSWLSSSFAGIYKKTAILAFPGNPSSIIESLKTIEHLLPHIVNSMNKYD